MNISLRVLLIILLSLLGLGCAPKPSGAPQAPTVVATTTMLFDMARIIAGEELITINLMGPGTDPHLYKPTPKDASLLANASLILYNGLRLEGKMETFLKNLAIKGVQIHAAGENIPESMRLYPSEFEGHPDPHIWLDPLLWAECVPAITEALSALAPEHAPLFEARALALSQSYHALHGWAKERLNSIPEDQRVLITSHDAFNYFGRQYGFHVASVQGISTVTEAGLADITRVIDLIKARQVRAIFVESSVSPAAIERISKDSGARIGGELFSDSTGIPGKIESDTTSLSYDLGTYEGMFRHNVNIIAEGLSPL